jgi:S-adenosyl-L-methionine hydrolase (adenosine-forming)
MQLLSLTTDWGTKDHYRASVVGKLLSNSAKLQIVDITHEIPPHNIIEAAYVLRNAYKSFPKNSIHIIAVDAIASDEKPHTLVKANGHFFIAADNGIFSLLFGSKDKIETIVEIDVIQDSDFYTFPERDVFVKVALHIEAKKDIKILGDEKSKYKEALPYKAYKEQNALRGSVLYIDNYGNAITNISINDMDEIIKRQFSISFYSYSINKIHDSYDDVPENEMLALFGSNGLLQIAINKGRAAEMLRLLKNTQIRIDFER